MSKKMINDNDNDNDNLQIVFLVTKVTFHAVARDTPLLTFLTPFVSADSLHFQQRTNLFTEFLVLLLEFLDCITQSVKDLS